MKVKLTVGMAGDKFSYPPGQVIDVEKATAKRLLASGQAEPVARSPVKRASKRPANRGETR